MILACTIVPLKSSH